MMFICVSGGWVVYCASWVFAWWLLQYVFSGIWLVWVVAGGRLVGFSDDF